MPPRRSGRLAVVAKVVTAVTPNLKRKRPEPKTPTSNAKKTKISPQPETNNTKKSVKKESSTKFNAKSAQTLVKTSPGLAGRRPSRRPSALPKKPSLKIDIKSAIKSLTKERATATSTKLKSKQSKSSKSSSSNQAKRDSMEVDLMKTPIHLLRPLCRMLGISPTGSKNDIIYRLKNELSANRKETLNETIRRASGDLQAMKEMSLIDTNLQENFLAAGLTRLPDPASTAYEVAEWHEYDLSTKSWKSPCTLVRIKIDAKPFQRGAMRNAYKAYTLEHPDKVFVVKDYIDPETTHNVYFKDVQMQVACSYYAKAMMRRIDKCKLDTQMSPQRLNILKRCHPLSFNDTFMIKLVGSDKIYTGEYYMSGRYAKFNNNFGYVAERSDFMNDYAQAFSHFSYEESRGQMLICDIQGTNEILTDPQVHTADPDSGFGLGNLSTEGIEKFKETHHCLSVCKAIGLKPFPKSVSPKKKGKKQLAKKATTKKESLKRVPKKRAGKKQKKRN